MGQQVVWRNTRHVQNDGVNSDHSASCQNENTVWNRTVLYYPWLDGGYSLRSCTERRQFAWTLFISLLHGSFASNEGSGYPSGQELEPTAGTVARYPINTRQCHSTTTQLVVGSYCSQLVKKLSQLPYLKQHITTSTTNQDSTVFIPKMGDSRISFHGYCTGGLEQRVVVLVVGTKQLVCFKTWQHYYCRAN